MLIQRMSFPASFTPAAITACGLDEKDNAAGILAKSIKLSLLKGVPNVVEFKTTASNPERAQQCANAIFELIKTSQDKVMSPYIAEAKIRLADYEAQLAKQGEPLRWAITSVNVQKQTARIEAVVTLESPRA